MAAPPPPHLNLKSKANSKAKRAEEEDWRREVRIAGAPAVAEAAVKRNVAGASEELLRRRRYKAECAFGEANCLYWNLHDYGIEWKCAPLYK